MHINPLVSRIISICRVERNLLSPFICSLIWSWIGWLRRMYNAHRQRSAFFFFFFFLMSSAIWGKRKGKWEQKVLSKNFELIMLFSDITLCFLFCQFNCLIAHGYFSHRNRGQAFKHFVPLCCFLFWGHYVPLSCLWNSWTEIYDQCLSALGSKPQVQHWIWHK